MLSLVLVFASNFSTDRQHEGQTLNTLNAVAWCTVFKVCITNFFKINIVQTFKISAIRGLKILYVYTGRIKFFATDRIGKEINKLTANLIRHFGITSISCIVNDQYLRIRYGPDRGKRIFRRSQLRDSVLIKAFIHLKFRWLLCVPPYFLNKHRLISWRA